MILKCRWKLLDFALLKRNSVSFFDIEKPETAVSKWSRARMRAAKVAIVFFCSDIIIRMQLLGGLKRAIAPLMLMHTLIVLCTSAFDMSLIIITLFFFPRNNNFTIVDLE